MSDAEPFPPTQALYRDNPYLKACAARITQLAPEGVVLDRTVFYAQGGGQPGDQGMLRLEDGTVLNVLDTKRGGPAGDAILHVLAPSETALRPGLMVDAAIDWPLRHRRMRIHTALHLISALVAGKITGAQVGDGKGRVDFDLQGQALDKADLEARLNALVAEDRPVTARWIDEAELDANPDLCRSLSVQPPRGQGRVRLIAIDGTDLQACGGTHVAGTGEIGAVRVSKIESKGKQNRRVAIELVD